MAFETGNKIARGRPAGSVNRRSRDFIAKLEEHEFCPVTAMIECYREARKIFDNYGVIYDAICDAREEKALTTGALNVPPEDKAHTYLKIAGDMAKDIASYTYPKLKAIERTNNPTLDNMSAQEKLEAMKQAVAYLEMQVKAEQEVTA